MDTLEKNNQTYMEKIEELRVKLLRVQTEYNDNLSSKEKEIAKRWIKSYQGKHILH